MTKCCSRCDDLFHRKKNLLLPCTYAVCVSQYCLRPVGRPALFESLDSIARLHSLHTNFMPAWVTINYRVIVLRLLAFLACACMTKCLSSTSITYSHRMTPTNVTETIPDISFRVHQSSLPLSPTSLHACHVSRIWIQMYVPYTRGMRMLQSCWTYGSRFDPALLTPINRLPGLHMYLIAHSHQPQMFPYCKCFCSTPCNSIYIGCVRGSTPVST